MAIQIMVRFVAGTRMGNKCACDSVASAIHLERGDEGFLRDVDLPNCRANV
ncbi:hypothetical protein [uncultured Bradyrhizobium sp.]|uniref:hypothetical protein n=1 Tax=Bradyrhizobium sp. TaxID=376 RepID=UPI00263A239E|nr:hypothetical protein [uncultured Bradyrhizobium sp.]